MTTLSLFSNPVLSPPVCALLSTPPSQPKPQLPFTTDCNRFHTRTFSSSSPPPHLPAAWREGLGTESSPAALGRTPTPQKAPRNASHHLASEEGCNLPLPPPPRRPARWPWRCVTHVSLRPLRQLFPLPATLFPTPLRAEPSPGPLLILTAPPTTWRLPVCPRVFRGPSLPPQRAAASSRAEPHGRDSRGLQASFAGPRKCPVQRAQRAAREGARGPGPSARGRLPGAPRRARPDPLPLPPPGARGGRRRAHSPRPGRSRPRSSCRKCEAGDAWSEEHFRPKPLGGGASAAGAGRGGPGSWVLSLSGPADTPRRVPSPGSIPATPSAAQRPAPARTVILGASLWSLRACCRAGAPSKLSPIYFY